MFLFLVSMGAFYLLRPYIRTTNEVWPNRPLLLSYNLLSHGFADFFRRWKRLFEGKSVAATLRMSCWRRFILRVRRLVSLLCFTLSCWVIDRESFFRPTFLCLFSIIEKEEGSVKLFNPWSPTPPRWYTQYARSS